MVRIIRVSEIIYFKSGLGDFFLWNASYKLILTHVAFLRKKKTSKNIISNFGLKATIFILFLFQGLKVAGKRKEEGIQNTWLILSLLFLEMCFFICFCCWLET